MSVYNEVYVQLV